MFTVDIQYKIYFMCVKIGAATCVCILTEYAHTLHPRGLSTMLASHMYLCVCDTVTQQTLIGYVIVNSTNTLGSPAL